MTLENILEKIKSAQFPTDFPADLNIGDCDYYDERNDKLLNFYPSSSCSAFSHVRRVQDDANVVVHTHGIELCIDGTRVKIHNSQIITFDYYSFDGDVEFNRADTRGNRVALGWMLAGPIGAAVGLACSFGKRKKHVSSHNLILAYWNISKRKKEIVELEDTKGVKDEIVPKLVEYWQEQRSL